MSSRGGSSCSRRSLRAGGTRQRSRATPRFHACESPVSHRARTRALLAIALALFVLVGANAAAGAVGGRPSETRATAHRARAEGGNATSTSVTDQLGTSKVATNRGNNFRDGWYPDEPGLKPQLVGSSGFGQVFKTQLNGQIYAQPLLVGNVLLVATETDWVYGLDPATGAVEWSRQIGTPFRDAPLNCGDLVPDLGVTSTPTIDPATGIAYLVDQAHLPGNSGVGWFMNAINPATGAEMPRFPVEIKGPATNNPLQPFVPTKELQRPGLLFLGGVVYAAFGSHCDEGPYVGLIVGVSTTGRQTTMWSDEASKVGGGGGIWQAGGGLSSDGPNQIFFDAGNGFGSDAHPNGPLPGSSPPANLADSVVRLIVQPDGSLKAKNFFSMYDDQTVDEHDWDLTSAPVVLPGQFSTPKYRRLVVVTGKQGVVYLLDADSLGGVDEGPGGKDLVLGEYGPNGEAISSAGTWPGDGGYVYVSTLQSVTGKAGAVDVYKFATTAQGLPALRLVGIGSVPAVFGVSGAVITSDGTTSGSAVVWVIDGASLQAYDPVPVNGKLKLLGTWFIGNSDPFNPPGMGDNIVYVGNQAGLLYGFGAKATTDARTDARMALP